MAMKSMGQHYTAKPVIVASELTTTSATAGAEIDRRGFNALSFVVTADYTGATAQDAEIVVTFKDGNETGVLEDCTSKPHYFANEMTPLTKATPAKIISYIGANRFIKPSFTSSKASATGIKISCVAVLDKSELFK